MRCRAPVVKSNRRFRRACRAVSSDSVDSILQKVGTVNNALGLDDPATAEVYGQICLGMGYRQDNAEMALAGALILVASGKAPYGELVGHHVREGFGVAANATASKPWYESAVTALEQGQPPVFEPSTTTERVMVIRKAIEMGRAARRFDAAAPTGANGQPVGSSKELNDDSFDSEGGPLGPPFSLPDYPPPTRRKGAHIEGCAFDIASPSREASAASAIMAWRRASAFSSPRSAAATVPVVSLSAASSSTRHCDTNRFAAPALKKP